jgi:predicted phage terminase large subunit-like protein
LEAARRGLTIPDLRADRPLSFRDFVDGVYPRYRWYRHCVVLADVLQRVADGEIKRLMIFMPPRHGKSLLASRLFSAYWLYRHPEQWVGLNSYGADLAFTLSRSARDNFAAAGGVFSESASAVNHWETAAGGGMWAAGVGGPISGKGFNLGIIDDPIKNAEDAASEVIREKQKEWYNSTFYTREEPNSDGDPDGAIVIIQTRWHMDDLSGWLLSEEGDGDGGSEGWHIVCLDAIHEADPPEFPPTCTVEPDWREPGEALCPERRPLSKLERIRRAVASYFWAALFQQRPTPRTGGMFPPTWPIVKAIPVGCTFVRYWDKAGTAGGGAYTAGVKMARAPDGSYYVVHVERGQWSAGEREAVIKATAAMDGKGVAVWVEQEGGSGGKESAENTVIMLAGYAVHKDPVSGSKPTRAEPLAAQAEVGNVRLLEGAWNRDFVDEAKLFPHGKYLDQIDAAAGAFNKLALAPPPRRMVAGANPLRGYRG